MIGSPYARAGAVAVMLMVLAACGADAPEGSQKSSGSAPADKSAVSSGGTGTGTIKIGDFQHDLTIVRCQNLAGAIGGQAVSVSDPNNVEVSFEFPPEDWAERPASEGWSDSAAVRIDSEDPELQWQTGAESSEGFNLPAGMTAQDVAVTSFDIADDGSSVAGEGQFIELNALFAGTLTESTKGTFAFSCPAKG